MLLVDCIIPIIDKGVITAKMSSDAFLCVCYSSITNAEVTIYILLQQQHKQQWKKERLAHDDGRKFVLFSNRHNTCL